MQCQHCGTQLSQPAPSFCPNCGTTTAAQPQGGAAESAKQAAAAAKETAAKVAGNIKAKLDDPNVLGRIPGRSVSIAGLAIMALAILISLLPWFGGDIGWFWTIIMLLGGALVAVQELRSGGVELPWASGLPPVLMHPVIPPVFAALAAVHAFQLFNFRIWPPTSILVPWLWVAAAFLLCYDQYRKAILAPNSFGQYFDLRLTWYGYRRYILIGAAICLFALFFTWGKTASWWSGGYSYSSYYGGYEYNPFQYFWAGFEFTGRSQALVLWIEMALVALVVWSAYRGDGTVPTWFNYIAAGLAGFVTLWWLLHIRMHLGPWIFLLGLAAIDFAVVMINLGKHDGQFGPDQVVGQIKSLKR